MNQEMNQEIEQRRAESYNRGKAEYGAAVDRAIIDCEQAEKKRLQETLPKPCQAIHDRQPPAKP